MSRYTIGFIGAGNMAGAIIKGMVSGGLVKPEQIAVYDIKPESVDAYVSQGFGGCDSIVQLASQCDYIVLSAKPQNFTAILDQIKTTDASSAVFVSIAAGISAEQIKQGLGFDAKVIRVMPNTPLLIGCGSTALSKSAPVTNEEFAFVKKLFAAAGAVEEIAPDQMNEVIPLNGSSPAYIYRFAQIFVARAVEKGFDADTANRLFCHSLIGSAKMMLETGKDHQQLIDMVTSPGGATFRGLDALERCGFEDALNQCFEDTIKRAYELGS